MSGLLFGPQKSGRNNAVVVWRGSTVAPKDLSLDEFKAKISWRYDFEKHPPSIS